MQIGRQFIPVAADYNYLFKDTRLRNRVELVSDFPNNNDAQVISSLQVCKIILKIFSNCF